MAESYAAQASGDSLFNYIAYIDEAGDPGLRHVRPIDSNGSSEWLILGAYIVRTGNLRAVEDLHAAVLARINSQTGALHYRNLSASRKAVVARALTKVPCRGIVVASNKKNMRQHRNYRAEKIRSQDWFYNWCLRLLIERITKLCVTDAVTRDCEPTCKLVFSERGSFDYSQMDAYHSYMRLKGNRLYPTGGAISWEALEPGTFEVQSHYDVPGLQFADVVASSFFDAADTLRPRGNYVAPALALSPIMARRDGKAAKHGVALFPSKLEDAQLSTEQKAVFEAYGYQFSRPRSATVLGRVKATCFAGRPAA